jgi:CHAT domain-containing protein
VLESAAVTVAEPPEPAVLVVPDADKAPAGPLPVPEPSVPPTAEAGPADRAPALHGPALAAAAAGRAAEAVGLLRDLGARAPSPAADLYRDPENVDLFLSLVWRHQREAPTAVRAALDFVLRHRHARFAGEEAEAGPREVAHALPAGSALVELVRFTPSFVGQDSDPVMARQDRNPVPRDCYLAFVLAAGEPDRVTLLDLGEAVTLDRLVTDFRAWIADAQPAPAWRPADARSMTPPAAVALRQALLDPLAPALAGRTRWFVAPAGALAGVPLDVLPQADGRPLLETHEVSYVDSGLDVLYFGTAPEEQPGPSVVVADPDFDLFCLGARTTDAPAVRPAPDPDAVGRFERLTATRRAAKHFAALLGVEPWLGGLVRKRRLQGLRSPRVLHLATHAALDAGPALALAGANGYGPGHWPAEGDDDGLLTAAEVAGLDLQATELVVLSSCDPGPAAAPAAEALLALRRAFLQAGAAAVVLSLWKVADYHVKELLSDFYQRLLAGAGRAEALRQARLALRERYPDRPEYWGAFACHGDPGPLRPLPGPRKKARAAGLAGVLGWGR